MPVLSPHLWKDRGALAILQVISASTHVCEMSQAKEEWVS